MPWVDSVPAVVHAWYLGNATGDAIADILFGMHNPSGKLPLTFPKVEDHIPSFGYFHSENGKVRYAEDLFVVCHSLFFCFSSSHGELRQGYKHYQHRKIAPLFPFG